MTEGEKVVDFSSYRNSSGKIKVGNAERWQQIRNEELQLCGPKSIVHLVDEEKDGVDVCLARISLLRSSLESLVGEPVTIHEIVFLARKLDPDKIAFQSRRQRTDFFEMRQRALEFLESQDSPQGRDG
jgi:hypothetical protein